MHDSRYVLSSFESLGNLTFDTNITFNLKGLRTMFLKSMKVLNRVYFLGSTKPL